MHQVIAGDRFSSCLLLFILLFPGICDSLSNPVPPPRLRRPPQPTTVVQVRDVLELVSTRYSTENNEWKRLRSYLYRTNREKLTFYQVKKVLNFLDDTFTPERSPQIIEQSPRILQRNVDTKLLPTFEFLLSLYGEDRAVEAIERNPDLLLTASIGYSGDALDLIEQLLKDELSLTEKQVDRLKRSYPSIFQTSASQLLSAISFFRSILQHVTNQTQRPIAQLIMAHPHVFQLSVPNNLEPRRDFLYTALGPEIVARKCCQPVHAAAVWGLSVAESLQPKVEFLQARQADISRHPGILGLSFANIHSKVAYFDAIGGGREYVTNRILNKTPAVFSLSLQENLVPKIEFLHSLWGEERTAKEICVYPAILSLSLARNLRPTAQFYRQIAGFCGADIQGRHLAASLYHRLIPRYYFANTPTLSLNILATVSDTNYCRLIGRQAKEFEEFRKKEAESLRFRNQWKAWLQYGTPIDV